MDLTHKECEALIEALEEWENNSDAGGMILGAMLQGMAGDNEEVKAKIEKTMDEKKRKQAEKRRERKKISARLKAKLYNIQDQIVDRDIEAIKNPSE